MDLGRIAMVSMRDRSGCSSFVSESLNTFWKLIFGFGGASEDLLCLGAMVDGRGPSISAPKSLVFGCAISGISWTRQL